MPSSLFLRNQLKYLQSEVSKVDYPERLIASGRLLPVSNEIPKGAASYEYKLMTVVGSAKVIATGAEDLPAVNAYMETRLGRVRTLATKFSISHMELENAEFAGVNIAAEMAIGARDVIEAQLDNIGYLGDANYQLMGLLGHAHVPNVTVANDGTGSSTLWSAKTADLIYRDLNDAVATIHENGKLAYTPDTLLLPITQFNLINRTVYPSGTMGTVLSFFLDTQSRLPGGVKRVLPVPFLAGQGTGGGNLGVFLTTKADKIKFHVVSDFEMLPMERVGLSYETPCLLKTGGIQLTKPLSMSYMQGI